MIQFETCMMLLLQLQETEATRTTAHYFRFNTRGKWSHGHDPANISLLQKKWKTSRSTKYKSCRASVQASMQASSITINRMVATGKTWRNGKRITIRSSSVWGDWCQLAQGGRSLFSQLKKLPPPGPPQRNRRVIASVVYLQVRLRVFHKKKKVQA